MLIVDMITDFDFEGGKKLFKNTRPIAARIRELRKRARKAKVPVVYVNDGFGRWAESTTVFVEDVKARSAEAKEIVPEIAPSAGDYLILKPQRSGFYGTSLGNLLLSFGVNRIIVTGVATDICILFTAHDAHMRGFNVAVPSDCTAAETDKFHQDALRLMKRVAEVDTGPSNTISFTNRGKRAQTKSKELVHDSAIQHERSVEDIVPAHC